MLHPSSTLKRYMMLAAVYVAAMSVSPLVVAGVIIEGTRQIYPQQRREITVRLTNDDKKKPRLVQAWLDDGSPDQGPESSDVPFTLSPPVFRLDSGKSQAMRLSYTQQPLAQDRETLFWLNVLEVPPKTDEFDVAREDSDLNQLNFAFRIRTKVFFRPSGLAGKPDEAPGQLRWAVVQSARGSMLTVHNPTAYHVTFNEVALVMGTGKGARRVEAQAGMVAPGDSLTLPVRQAVAVVPADAQVAFTYINDFGAFSPLQQVALRR